MTYEPDTAIPPGETLAEVLLEQSITRQDFAHRSNIELDTLNGILHKGQPITPEIAIKLEKALNITASFWNNLEKNYRETLARIKDRRER